MACALGDQMRRTCDEKISELELSFWALSLQYDTALYLSRLTGWLSGIQLKKVIADSGGNEKCEDLNLF